MTMPIHETRVTSTDRIQPNQANNYQTAHGGEVVKLMDELAAVSAMGVAGELCVTARIGSVNFRRPVPVGHVAETTAYVYDTGKTSLEVQVTVESRPPTSTASETTTSACFTMVAVDESGDPLPVPDVTVEDEEDRSLLSAANCA
jgi:acyl-CoA hydrolase